MMTQTPYEVGFLGEPFFGVLFIVNRGVDVGFIIDMILQFFLVRPRPPQPAPRPLLKRRR